MRRDLPNQRLSLSSAFSPMHPPLTDAMRFVMNSSVVFFKDFQKKALVKVRGEGVHPRAEDHLRG